MSRHHETQRQAPAEKVVAFVALKDHNLKLAAQHGKELSAMMCGRGAIENLVSCHIPADPKQERSLGIGYVAPPWRVNTCRRTQK